ncbi:nucleotidyltransferase family protein [Paraglaciecola aestuariivivens]
MQLTLLLLAAGNSQRFNGIKQLADINGQPMICHSLATYRFEGNWLTGIDDGVVVLGANAQKIKAILPQSVNTYLVTEWHKGMGESLAQAIQNLSEDTTHVLVALADQVALSKEDIQQFINVAQQNPIKIISAKYQNQLGAPCIFPRHYFGELSQLTGAKGAKSIIQDNLTQVYPIETPTAAVDIDSRQDLLNL